MLRTESAKKQGDEPPKIYLSYSVAPKKSKPNSMASSDARFDQL